MSVSIPEFESLAHFVSWWGSPDMQPVRSDAQKLCQLAQDSRVRPWLDEFLRAVQKVRPDYSGKAEDTLEMLTTSTSQYEGLVTEVLQFWQMETTWEMSEEAQQEEMQTFSRYRNLCKVGEGGFGTVYKAYDPELDRVVALKLFKFRTPVEVEEFKKEAKLAARLQHPNVISVHEFGVIDNQPYYTMDFFEGKTLRDLLDERGKLPVREAFRIGAVLADALSYAHSNGILHRDVKPANVFMDREGRTHIGDFGVAKQVEAVGKQATTSRMVGTPYYMSPEQADCRPLDARSDVWALGVVLYIMLCGTYPFQGSTASDLFTRIWLDEPIPPRKHNPKVDRDAGTIVLKCLEKDVARRYESAGALRDDLQRYLNGEPIKARPIGVLEKLWRRAKRHKTASISILVVLLAVAVISALLWRQSVRWEAESRFEELLMAPTPDEKLRRLEEIIAIDPAWLTPCIEKGRLLKNAGRHTEAVAAFEQALEVAHGNGDRNGEAVCCFHKAVIYWGRKECERALPFFSRVLELMPDVRNPMTLYAQAARAYFEKQYDEAVGFLDEAIRLDPRFTEAYNDRGITRHAKGEFADAIEDYSKAIELNPNPVYYTNRGIARRDKGDINGAIADCMKALELGPRYAPACLQLGIAFFVKEEHGAALGYLDKAVRLARVAGDKKTQAEACMNRGNVFCARGNYPQAIAEHTKATTLNPKLAVAFYNCGMARAKSEDYDGAIADFEKVLQIDPDLWEACVYLAGLYAGKSDREQVLNTLKHLLSRKPEMRGWARQDSVFDWLRGDPEFQKLLGE